MYTGIFQEEAAGWAWGARSPQSTHGAVYGRIRLHVQGRDHESRQLAAATHRNRSHRRSTAVSGRRAAVPRRGGMPVPVARGRATLRPSLRPTRSRGHVTYYTLTSRRIGLMFTSYEYRRTVLTRPVRLRAKAHASKRVDTHTSQAGGARADLPRAQRLSLLESGSDSDSSQTSTRNRLRERVIRTRAAPAGRRPCKIAGRGRASAHLPLVAAVSTAVDRTALMYSFGSRRTYVFRGGEGAVAAAHSLPCCRFMMRSSISGRKARMRPCTGHAAASPSAQIVCPSIW